MDWRLRGIPPALWRIVRDKAGDRLQEVLIGLLDAYAKGQIDPLAEKDPARVARGQKHAAAMRGGNSAER